MKSKILVTGGLGFIGHNLCIALKKQGHNVNILDNLSHNITKPWHKIIISQRKKLIEECGINLIEADTIQENVIEKIITSFDPEKIIHTAAIPDARLSNKDPSAGFDQNLLSTKILLEIIRRNDLQINQFTYLSSSMIYGDFKGDIVRENVAKDPKGIYGAAKLSSELLIKAYHNLIDLPYTIIRPSALYGPRCINNRVTQIFIENAIRNKPVVLQGDGTQRLDFTNIEDFTDGFMITQTNKKAINDIFNLTTGHSEKLVTLTEILGAYFKDLEVIYEPWENIIPKRGTLNIDKMKKLGFSPNYNIQNGYPKYIEWYLSNKKIFNIN